MSSIKFSATRKPGGRPPVGRGRPAVRNSTPSHVLEGAYMNPRMVHVLTSVVGARCELLVKSGKVFEGIFRTYGPKYEVVLDAAHQQSADSTQSGPKSEEIVNTMIFSPSDVVLVQYKDVDLNYATRDGFTDSVIVRRVNGEHRERELEPWQGGDGAGDDMSSLDTDMSNGWDPNEMFRYNEENYGVKSTYDSSLANYTTRLDKDSSEEFQKREARAEQLAREIESSPQYRTHAALENDDGRTEEDRFSSVQRRQQQQQPDRDGPTLYTRGRYVPPGQRSGPLGRGGGRQNSPKFGRQGAGPQPSRGGYRYPEPSPSPGLDHRALNGAGRGAIRSQVTQSPKPGQELSTPPGLMVGAPAGVQAFGAAGAGHAQPQPLPVTAIQPAPGMPQPVAWVSVPPPGVPQPSSAQAGALAAQQGVAAVAAAAHAPPSASKVPDVHLVASPATAPANTIVAAAQAPAAMAAAAATVVTTAAFQQPTASVPVTGLSIPRGAVLSAAPTTSSGMTSGAESACQPQPSSAEGGFVSAISGKETSIHVEQGPQNMIADQQQARAPGAAQPILQRAPSAVPVRVPYQSVLEAKKNPIEELKRFSAEFKLNLNQAEPGPQEERSTRDKSKGDGAEVAAECSTGTQTTDTPASTQAANSGSQTAGSAVPQAVASLGTGGEVTATKPGSEGPNVISESTPKADVESSKDKGESDATDSKKSNLNPNAKEFVLNPSAKPFIPMVKPVPTPTPPRPQQASPSVIMPAPQGPLYTPQPLAAYPPVIPINQVPAAYQVPVPLNQHKPYRPTKGTMPQIRSDHAHPQSNQAILHSVSMATVSAPPLGASYSHAFIPYSPQHYPSQPNLLHYQPLHQAGAVYPPLMQGGSRVLAAPQMGPGQAGLVGAPSSSSPQYPPNAESAPPPQTIYVSPAPVHQHYPPPHPGSLHALTAHAQQGAPTHAAPNQHPGGQQMPSAMQLFLVKPQGGQHPHMGAPQQHQAAGLYPGGLVSQGPGPHGQPGGYPHPHAHPQHIYTIHPPHHGYSSPAGLPPNAQSHAAHPAPVMLMAAHPSSSGHGGPPGPPHPHQGPMSLSGVPSMAVSSGAPYAYMTLQPQGQGLFRRFYFSEVPHLKIPMLCSATSAATDALSAPKQLIGPRQPTPLPTKQLFGSERYRLSCDRH
uniref:Ataxin-2-like isoform X3 n=1 Tax=Petromyzon marinus TaxID=7757 RepID=A0AAJ7WME9_PETMA|nr:ataxin-2-like isoform X3 [Petromyzon marinus]